MCNFDMEISLNNKRQWQATIVKNVKALHIQVQIYPIFDRASPEWRLATVTTVSLRIRLLQLEILGIREPSSLITNAHAESNTVRKNYAVYSTTIHTTEF